MTWCQTVALFLSLGWVSAAAWAREPGRPDARLQYEVAAGLDCPSAEVFVQLVHAKTGYPAIRPEAQARLGIRIAPEGASALTGYWSWEEGAEPPRKRQFSAPRPHCRELVEQMVLATAVSLDPTLGLAIPLPAPPPEPAPPPPPPAPHHPTPLPPVEVRVGLGPTLGTGLSSLSIGGVLDVRRQWTLLSLGGELEVQGAVPSPVTATSSFSTAHAQVRGSGCLHAQAFMGCALLGSGLLWATSEGLTAPHAVWIPSFHVGAAVGAEWFPPTGAWGARALLLGACQPTRMVLQVESRHLWTSPVCSAGARVQLVWRTVSGAAP